MSENSDIDQSPPEPAQPTQILPQVTPAQPPQAEPHYGPHIGPPSQPEYRPAPPPAQPSYQPPAQPIGQPPAAAPQEYGPTPAAQQYAPSTSQGYQPAPPQEYGPAGPPPWGAPPPEPPKKSRAWIAVLVAVLLVVLIGGAAGALVALRKSEPPKNTGSGREPAADEGTQSGRLKITFKSAETRYYRFELMMDSTMTGAGPLADDSGAAKVSQTMSSDVTVQVVDRLPGDVTRLKMTFSNTQIAMTINGQAASAQGLLPQEMEAFFKVHPDGTFEIETTPGLGPSSSPRANPFDGTTPFGGGLSSSPFGLSGPAPLLPEDPVKVGDTWKKTFETKVPGFTAPIRIDTTNTYERDEGTQWGKAMVILTKAIASIDLSTLDASQLGAPANFKYSGFIQVNIATRFWFVPELGEAVKQVVDPASTMKISLQIDSPELGAVGAGPMKIDMDMKLEMTMERQASPPPSDTKPKTPAVRS